MRIAGKMEFEELDQLFKEWNEKSREGVEVEWSSELDEMLDNKELMMEYIRQQS